MSVLKEKEVSRSVERMNSERSVICGSELHSGCLVVTGTIGVLV